MAAEDADVAQSVRRAYGDGLTTIHNTRTK
jgi:hypothetical protein